MNYVIEIDNFDFISEYRYISGVNGNVKAKHRQNERLFPFCVAVYVKKGKYFVEMHNKRYDISEEETVFIPSFDHGIGTEAAKKLSQQGGGFLFQNTCCDLRAAVIGQGKEIGQTPAGAGLAVAMPKQTAIHGEVPRL